MGDDKSMKESEERNIVEKAVDEVKSWVGDERAEQRRRLEEQGQDTGEQYLTTNQGVRISDNQNSLKAGARGPTLMEDFIFREKMTHFDHERIPELVVA